MFAAFTTDRAEDLNGFLAPGFDESGRALGLSLRNEELNIVDRIPQEDGYVTDVIRADNLQANNPSEFAHAAVSNAVSIVGDSRPRRERVKELAVLRFRLPVGTEIPEGFNIIQDK